MAKLSAIFQVSLLFLFNISPSVQTPIRIYNNFQKSAIRYVDASRSARTNGGGQSMHTPTPPDRFLEETHGSGYGIYYVRVGFGTPPTTLQFDAMLNTESGLTWIQCTPCPDCYKQKDHMFTPAMSNSYKPLPCYSGSCPGLGVSSSSCHTTSETCLYQVEYVDGSVTEGDFATETLSFQDTSISVGDVLIGCGHHNKGTFSGDASGMFALGRSSSFLSQAKYTAFSYCVSHNNSDKSVLQFDSVDDSLVTTAMLMNKEQPSLYYVELTGISVNQQVFALPPLSPSTGEGGSIVGLGTAVSRLPTEVYNQVRDAFVEEATRFTRVGDYSILDTCYDAETSQAGDFPTIAFHFGASPVTLPPNNVMYPVENRNLICFGFAPADTLYSTIGNYQQQGIRVSFDTQKSVVGFLPDQC